MFRQKRTDQQLHQDNTSFPSALRRRPEFSRLRDRCAVAARSRPKDRDIVVCCGGHCTKQEVEKNTGGSSAEYSRHHRRHEIGLILDSKGFVPPHSRQTRTTVQERMALARHRQTHTQKIGFLFFGVVFTVTPFPRNPFRRQFIGRTIGRDSRIARRKVCILLCGSIDRSSRFNSKSFPSLCFPLVTVFVRTDQQLHQDC